MKSNKLQHLAPGVAHERDQNWTALRALPSITCVEPFPYATRRY